MLLRSYAKGAGGCWRGGGRRVPSGAGGAARLNETGGAERGGRVLEGKRDLFVVSLPPSIHPSLSLFLPLSPSLFPLFLATIEHVQAVLWRPCRNNSRMSSATSMDLVEPNPCSETGSEGKLQA